MTLPNNKFREAVFQSLCCLASTSLYEDIVPLVMQQLQISKRNAKAALDKAIQIFEIHVDLDQKIKSASITYAFERIRLIELNVLRLGLFEIFYDESIPDKVAITEAMRICKKFSTVEAATFVNALLDRLYKEKCGLTCQEENLANVSQALLNEEENLESLPAHLTT